MTALDTDLVTPQALDVATQWLQEFSSAFEAGDMGRVESLFGPGSTWRDFLALTWDITNFREPAGIAEALFKRSEEFEPANFRVRRTTEPVIVSSGDVNIVTFLVEFDTNVGPCVGSVMLNDVVSEGWTATAVVSILDGLHDFPEAADLNRPEGKVHGVVMGRLDWAEVRRREIEFVDAEPQVLILGAGQAGLMLAARLRVLGVSSLLVERNERVGDNWRNRYGTLATHDDIAADHFPYMPFPTTWPNFSPKDKLGDFFEYYANALELNVWTSSSVESVEYHADEERWSIGVKRADGTVRVMRPRHFVSATGLNSIPRYLEFDGQSAFKGQIVHSGDFGGGKEWKGKNVLVIGGGTSGHDVAQDCYEQGATVVMAQRSTNNTIDIESFHDIFSSAYRPGGPHYEDADIHAAVLPFDRQIASSAQLQKVVEERDATLRAGLTAAGFGLDSGINGDGPASAFRSGRNSYYFDIGCASLIVEGKIKVKQGVVVDHLTEDSAVFSDGSTVPVDLIVTATGYGTTLEATRPVIGDAIAAKVLPIYQLGTDGEMLGTWKRSGHDGLWFMLGTLQQSRFHSKVLALQIKSIEEGLQPYSLEVDRSIGVDSY